MRADPALRLLAVGRLAAGNVLSRRPALVLGIDAAAGATCDGAGVGRVLAALATDLGEEFALARVTGAADPVAGAVAATLVALMANGRDLAAMAEPVPAAAGRTGWRLLVETGIDGAGPELARLAVDIVHHVLSGTPSVDRLGTRIGAALGTRQDRYARNQRTLLAAALDARGVPWRRTSDHPIGVIGEGRRRVRLRNSLSRRTMVPGAMVAERKDEANARLARLGLPVARQCTVADAAAACAAAERIGYPVVVKPVDCSNGRGVAAGLETAAAVAAAFEAARGHSASIVVEAHLPGRHCRFLVVGGRLVGLVDNPPGRLVGDGVRSIRELAENADRARTAAGPRPPLPELRLTPDILAHLARGGRGPATVPAVGEIVELHWHGHLSRGSEPGFVDPAVIHPDNRRAACQAAQAIGLDVAGLDMILPDLGRSWRETGGGICEINRAPGFRTHSLAEGRLTAALPAYLDHVLGAGRSPLVPIVAFLGGEGLDPVVEAAAGRLSARGLAVGLATGARLEAAGLPLRDPGPGDPDRVRLLVDDPAVDAVLVVVDPAVVLERGFGHGRADLAVVPDGAAAEPAATIARLLGAATVDPDGLATGPVLDRLAAGAMALRR